VCLTDRFTHLNKNEIELLFFDGKNKIELLNSKLNHSAYGKKKLTKYSISVILFCINNNRFRTAISS
jgi:hypothetical protein